MSINFYNTIHKKNKTINPHFDKHGIDIPFRMIIASPSGSGKTHQLCRLIYEFGKTFNEIYICALSADEPLYEMIEQRLKNNIFIGAIFFSNIK
jgi:archaellum biogenesis ATPase FlaH